MEVDGPPERRMRGNDGSTVVEFQTQVGSMVAPSDARETLELYGICTDYAIHRWKGHVWKRCLFSEECLQMIREMRAEGQFPYEVEAIPSQAEAEWQIARAAGATERTPPPLHQYLLPASIETLARLQSVIGERKLVRLGIKPDWNPSCAISDQCGVNRCGINSARNAHSE